MSAAKSFDIAYIARVLKMRKAAGRSTVLVLGSRTGGLFRSISLYKTLEEFGPADFQGNSHLHQFTQAYHLLVTQANFSPADLDSIFRHALREISVSEANRSLAELVKEELFDVIITANIDSTLEDSLAFVGLREPYDFEIFNAGISSGKALFHFARSAQCSIVKVFGDLNSRQYTMLRSGHFSLQPELRTWLEEVLRRDVLVIGLDPLWDAELSWIFPLQGDAFWFINESMPDATDRLVQIGNGRLSRYIIGENAAYEPFISKLLRYFMETPLPDTPAKQDNQLSVTPMTIDGPQETVSSQTIASVRKEPLNIFLSYASEDEHLLNGLLEHLAALKRAGSIREWFDRKILPGENRQDEIDKHLQEANIILLLVSSNFMKSAYMQSDELIRIMQLHQEKKAHIIPILLRPVDWESAPFSHLEILPKNQRPVTRWRNRDQAWLGIVQGIKTVAQHFNS